MTKADLFRTAHAAARVAAAAGHAYRAAFAAGLRAAYVAQKAPRPLAEIVAALPQVERISAWQDRIYVNLSASRGSRFRADTATKIWLRGSVLTVEAGRGYASGAFVAAKDALVAAVLAAGGTVRTA